MRRDNGNTASYFGESLIVIEATTSIGRTFVGLTTRKSTGILRLSPPSEPRVIAECCVVWNRIAFRWWWCWNSAPLGTASVRQVPRGDCRRSGPGLPDRRAFSSALASRVWKISGPGLIARRHWVSARTRSNSGGDTTPTAPPSDVGAVRSTLLRERPGRSLKVLTAAGFEPRIGWVTMIGVRWGKGGTTEKVISLETEDEELVTQSGSDHFGVARGDRRSDMGTVRVRGEAAVLVSGRCVVVGLAGMPETANTLLLGNDPIWSFVVRIDPLGSGLRTIVFVSSSDRETTLLKYISRRSGMACMFRKCKLTKCNVK